MERQFALPIALAAAVHVGLLFGITNSPTTAPGDPPPPPPSSSPPPDSDPVVVTLAADTDPAKEVAPERADRESPPVTTEPPPLPANDPFVIQVPDRATRNPEHPVVNLDGLDRLRGAVGDRTGTEGGGRSLIDARLLDHPPRTRLRVPPQYPPDKRRTGGDGEVIVEFMVDENGAVLAPRVVRTTDHAFDEPTLRAVSRWRFEPGTRDGRVVPFRMAVPVVFKLDRE
ncbi:MAG: energy transducer TonB [Verrucomicrobia bacterium]|nr:energy transducer TonB [Verrucomicrobiota bacterium]